MKRIGIDLGGTKIEGVVVDEALNVEHKLRLPTPSTDGYEAVVQQVGKVVTELEAMHGAPSSRHWHPRAISQVTGLMKNSNSVALNGKPLKEDLERVLERPIRMANDANCFALSEAVDGAAKGHDVVFESFPVPVSAEDWLSIKRFEPDFTPSPAVGTQCAGLCRVVLRDLWMR